MIVFDLKCSKGHCFEEWFDSGADYEDKAASGAITCPECADTAVTKALMAPNVNTGGRNSVPTPACGGASDCANTMCPMAGRS